MSENNFEMYAIAQDLFENRRIVCIPLRKYKQPAVSNWSKDGHTVQTELPDKSKWSSAEGYGVLTGRISGLTVVDVDKVHINKDEICGVAIFDQLLKQYGPLDCPKVATPSGGFHLYFAFCEDLSQTAKVNLHQSRGDYNDGARPIKVALDLRNEGGYVCGPGSIYSTASENRKTNDTDGTFEERCSKSDKCFKQKFTGVRYTWFDDLKNWAELPPMPEWIKRIYTHDLLLGDDGQTIEFVSKELPKPSSRSETRVATKKSTKRKCTDDVDVCVKGIEYTAATEEPSCNDIDIKTVEQILTHLKPSRCDDRDSWLRVLLALKHTSEACQMNLLPLADQWSRQSSKYQGLEDVKKTYESGGGDRANPTTIATLWHWLKEDNPQMFNTLQNQLRREYFYDDYMELGEEQAKQGYLDSRKVTAFLTSAVAKVLNGGNECWFVRTRNDGWVLQHRVPFQSVSSNLKFRCRLRKKHRANDDHAAPNEEPEYEEYSLYGSLLTLQHTGRVPWYQRADFVPFGNRNHPPLLHQTLNLFTGFPWQPIDVLPGNAEETLAPILQHLQHVLCGGDDNVYHYVLCWLAHMVQYPAKKVGTCLAIKSKPGAGKNVFFDFMERVIGSRHYHMLNDLDHLTGRFNGRLEGHLLCVLNEIQNWGGNFRSNDKLKSILTDELMYIEPKGKEAYSIHDYCRYVMLSNNDWFVKVEADDRRYVMIEASNHRCGDFEYFQRLSEAMNKENAELLFQYLYNVPLEAWNFRSLPRTRLKDEFKWNNRESLPLRYLVAVARNERVGRTEHWPDKQPCLHIHLSSLYADFKEWLREQAEACSQTQRVFHQTLEQAGLEFHEKVEESNPLSERSHRRSGFRLTRADVQNAIRRALHMPDFDLRQNME